MSKKCKKPQNDNNIRVVPAGMEYSGDSDEDTALEYRIKKTCENMKITIVPDITLNAGLNGEAFDASLEENISTWFEQFRQTWLFYKKGPAVSQTLFSFFSTCDNPLLSGLKLFVNAPDFDNPKVNSLAYSIMENLNEYKRLTNLNISIYLDDNIKMIAFNLVKKQGNSTLFKIIVDIYNLIISKHLFVGKIREILLQHHYKEACQMAYELELFHEFTVFDFIFPLILQDKISIAEEYLNKAVHLQKTIIELLDTLLERGSSVQAKCDTYIIKYSYTDVRLDRLHAKPLTKFITRLAKKYDVPKEIIPNVHYMKNYGALQFLLHKKYYEKSLNKDSWEEMVKETVSVDSIAIQMELILACTQYGDYAEAVKWANFYNVPNEKLPNVILNFKSKNQEKLNDIEVNWDDFECNKMSKILNNDEIHKLNSMENNIYLIDTKNLFYNMIDYLKTKTIIAFDSEWKPTFGTTTEVALIQLATSEKIYLIDVVILDITPDDWALLGRFIFNNDEILKIGFAPATDLTMFQKTIPALNLYMINQLPISYLDLQDLWRKLNNIPGFKFPYTGDSTNENLSNLVKLSLGKKLDKSNQFSNWEKRPLRQDQLHYAALDAYCLIEIYNIIENEIYKLGIDFNELLTNFFIENKNKLQYKKKDKVINQQKKYQQFSYKSDYNHLTTPIRVNEIKFVCDTMLEGLSKALRRCGIDTVSLKNTDLHDACVRIALREQRCILTRGYLFDKLSQYVGPYQCFQVTKDLVDDQLLEVINYYNINVLKENVFSRCQICNSDEFISVTQEEMKELSNNLNTCNKVKLHQLKDDWSTSTMQQYNNIIPERTFKLSNLTSYTKMCKTTRHGYDIQISNIPNNILNTVYQFYICEGCGKCYWDGTHLNSMLTGTMKTILSKNQN